MTALPVRMATEPMAFTDREFSQDWVAPSWLGAHSPAGLCHNGSSRRRSARLFALPVAHPEASTGYFPTATTERSALDERLEVLRRAAQRAGILMGERAPNLVGRDREFLNRKNFPRSLCSIA